MLVGLLGKFGSGKDSAAAVFVEHGWTRVGFADKLKAAAYAINPWIETGEYDSRDSIIYARLQDLIDDIGWDRAKVEYPEVRAFLQDLGVSMRNEVDESIWVNAALRNRAENLVISDVRFPNEWAAIQAGGGVLIRIERPGHNGDGHISETALDDFEPNYTLVNDGTLDDLKVGVEIIMAHILGNLSDDEIMELA